MTEFEKSVYNTFLRVKRVEQNKPFRARKNFDKFEDGDDYPYVKKLGMFFNKFSHIKMINFFTAPYRVYTDSVEQFDLKFYTSPRPNSPAGRPFVIPSFERSVLGWLGPYRLRMSFNLSRQQQQQGLYILQA